MSVASDADAAFWCSDEMSDYHDIAKTFEQNIELIHPEYVTGSTGCDFCYRCPWKATTVDYYEYRGPDVKHIR